jgi:undecaprenyl-diphosphatase
MDLHADPPMTLARVTARHSWLLPVALVAFLLLTAGAVFNTLPWDEPITRWVVDNRTPWFDAIVRRISFLGSTPVVLSVAAVGAALSAKRCPRLAMAIVVIALARPATEFMLKELISRDRPAGDRMVNGTGYSFPSGHPMATAASWCLLPLVAALYTRRRVLWWTLAISVWTLAVLVAMSRVWLGVHWTSDVIAALSLALLGVAGAERFIRATHPPKCCDDSVGDEAEHVDAQVVDRPVLEAAT